MNIIDKAIGIISPKAGFQRAYNRVRMLSMESQVRKYAGAADSRRHSSWISNANPSVKQLVDKDHKNLVSRARELSINNPYARKAPYIIANNMIGTGIIPTISIKYALSAQGTKKMPDADAKLLNINEAWKDWANNVTCDYNEDFNFFGMQHLAARTIVNSGEVLIIRKRVKSDINKFGLQIQMLEGDYIDTSKDTTKDPDGGYTFKGIKFNREGKRSGYWIFDSHPSEGNAKSNFIKIEDIIHVYDIERTGQTRGVPAASSSMLTQRDLADYMDAELLAKKGAACFSAFIQKEPEIEPGSGVDADELEKMEPGTIQYLQPGETVTFPSLPQNPGLSEFMKVQLRLISAGYLMPYETLTGDLSNVNFSSGRMGLLDFQRQLGYWQFSMFIPKFCDKIFAWFAEGASVYLQWEKELEISATWTAPRREMIDPVKEITGMRNEVRAGFASWQEKVRENGYDPIQVLKEQTEDHQKFKDAGLMPEWSPSFELTAKLSMQTSKEATKPVK